ncbi:MAG TPA: substrate-binding domain-containing protein [Bacteroidia bacterium]|jgi:phosphate transport system substrate-binding protein|nr:substrate-binding domain-containing protein [Bacteroidia bacterium]
MKKFISITLPLALLFLSGCSYDYKNTDSPTTGKLKIGIDDSYSLMMDSQIYTFEALYTYAKINPFYKPEADVIQDLLHDTVQAAIICRDLTDAEKEFFKQKQRIVTSTKIAVDGLALIVNPENPDTTLTVMNVRDIFTGKDTLWSQLDKSFAPGKINVVFDNEKSCNQRYISENIIDKKPFPKNCFAVKSNKEVIEYVHSNKNAMGVISVSWISDNHDPASQDFLRKIKVVALSEKEKPEASDYKKPYQAWIYEKTYPFRRDVYFVKTGLQETLGSGFAAFVAGEKGQLIIHKMGMVAATAPIRTVRISN